MLVSFSLTMAERVAVLSRHLCGSMSGFFVLTQLQLATLESCQGRNALLLVLGLVLVVKLLYFLPNKLVANRNACNSKRALRSSFGIWLWKIC